ncbi:MAG: Hsp20/alpha crystallin family protein [Candidatus Micrarchaeota archaeon]|nr:Hsp20/alpha crystallin family protein [Candidatus Micrarchaeota archaeon]
MAMLAKRKTRGEWLIPSSVFGFDELDSDFRRFMNVPMFQWHWNQLNQLPKVDLMGEGKSIKIRADLPGIAKNDIKVSVESNSVVIRALARKEQERKGKNYYFSERSASGYYRVIPLPTSVDPKSAKAKFSNGTLEITAKRAKEGKSGKDVRIE